MAEHEPKCQGHVLTVEAPESLTAAVDPNQLRQVLWNLVRNAAEASHVGRPVKVRLGLAAHGRWVRLEVVDEGTGVAPQVREHLFEPFQTTKPDGTGLGLAVVHRIVEAHGGTVELLPAPGGGTVARVELPRQ
jgi:two-component system sensor histidine kinase PilS (NtrC family)